MAAVTISKPESGSQIINCDAGSKFVFNFPMDNVVLSKNGDNLNLTFDDGSSIELAGFYTVYNKEQMPDFEINGETISGQDFFTAMNEPDLLPAAGPAAATANATGGRYQEYGNSDLLSGIDHLGALDTSSDNNSGFQTGLYSVGGQEDARTVNAQAATTIVPEIPGIAEIPQAENINTEIAATTNVIPQSSYGGYTAMAPTATAHTAITASLQSEGTVTEGGSIVYTITLSQPSASDISIILSNGDVLTIPAGETRGTIEIPARPDDVYKQGDEKVSISITEVSGAPDVEDIIFDPATVETVVVDDDDPTTIKLSVAQAYTEGEPIVVTATMDHVSSEDITVYLDNGGTITIPAGQTTGTLEIASREDDLYKQGGETVSISITNVSGGSDLENIVYDPDPVETVIVDDDDPTTIKLSVAQAYTEGEPIVITAAMDHVSSEDITVYLDNGGTITIPAGQTTGMLEIASREDDLYKQGDETVSISITNVSGGSDLENLTYDATPATTVVVDDDDATTVTLSVAPKYTEGEQIIFTATVERPSEEDITVYLDNNQAITIKAGESSGTVSIDSRQNEEYKQYDQTVSARIIKVEGGTDLENLIYNPAEAATVVVDDYDETKVWLTVDQEYTEGEEITYTAHVERVSDYPIIVTLDGGETITIAAGNLSGSVDIASRPDDLFKQDNDKVSRAIAKVEGGSDLENIIYAPDPVSTLVVDDVDPSQVLSLYATIFNDTYSITATVDNAPAKDITLTLSNNEQITIKAGETTGTSKLIHYDPEQTAITINSVSMDGKVIEDGGDKIINLEESPKDFYEQFDYSNADLTLPELNQTTGNVTALDKNLRQNDSYSYEVTIEDNSIGTLASFAAGESMDVFDSAGDKIGYLSIEDGTLMFTQTSAYNHNKGTDSAQVTVAGVQVVDTSGELHTLNVGITIADDSPLYSASNSTTAHVADTQEEGGYSYAEGAFTVNFGADVPYKLDENGDQILDGDGNPIIDYAQALTLKYSYYPNGSTLKEVDLTYSQEDGCYIYNNPDAGTDADPFVRQLTVTLSDPDSNGNITCSYTLEYDAARMDNNARKTSTIKFTVTDADGDTATGQTQYILTNTAPTLLNDYINAEHTVAASDNITYTSVITAFDAIITVNGTSGFSEDNITDGSSSAVNPSIQALSPNKNDDNFFSQFFHTIGGTALTIDDLKNADGVYIVKANATEDEIKEAVGLADSSAALLIFEGDLTTSVLGDSFVKLSTVTVVLGNLTIDTNNFSISQFLYVDGNVTASEQFQVHGGMAINGNLIKGEGSDINIQVQYPDTNTFSPNTGIYNQVTTLEDAQPATQIVYFSDLLANDKDSDTIDNESLQITSIIINSATYSTQDASQTIQSGDTTIVINWADQLIEITSASTSVENIAFQYTVADMHGYTATAKVNVVFREVVEKGTINPDLVQGATESIIPDSTVLILLDTSGSMRDNCNEFKDADGNTIITSYLSDSKAPLVAFLKTLVDKAQATNANITVKAIRFDNNAADLGQEVVIRPDSTYDDVQNLIDAINNFTRTQQQSNYGTNYKAAFEAAYEYLNGKENATVFFVTDGVPHYGTYEEGDPEMYADIQPSYKALNSIATVHAVGLGSDSELQERLAQYDSSGNPVMISDPFAQLANALIDAYNTTTIPDIIYTKDDDDVAFGDNAIVVDDSGNQISLWQYVAARTGEKEVDSAAVMKYVKAHAVEINKVLVDNGSVKGDALIGGSGNDILFGQSADDLLIGDGTDFSGNGDTLNSLAAKLGVDPDTDKIVNAIKAKAAEEKEDGKDPISELEQLIAGEESVNSDKDGNDLLFGGPGNDVLIGLGGNDYLNGGDGVDYLFGGSGNDLFVYDANDALISGGDGIDVLLDSSGTTTTLAELLNTKEINDDHPVARSVEVFIKYNPQSSSQNTSQDTSQVQDDQTQDTSTDPAAAQTDFDDITSTGDLTQLGVIINDDGETMQLDAALWDISKADSNQAGDVITYTYKSVNGSYTLETTLLTEQQKSAAEQNDPAKDPDSDPAIDITDDSSDNLNDTTAPTDQSNQTNLTDGTNDNSGQEEFLTLEPQSNSLIVDNYAETQSDEPAAAPVETVSEETAPAAETQDMVKEIAPAETKPVETDTTPVETAPAASTGSDYLTLYYYEPVSSASDEANDAVNAALIANND